MPSGAMKRESFWSYPAWVLWVLCLKCIVSSAIRTYLLSLGMEDNQEQEQQSSVFWGCLGIPKQQLKIGLFTTALGLLLVYGSWGKHYQLRFYLNYV